MLDEFGNPAGPFTAPFRTSPIRAHWRAFLVEGIVLLLLGLAAIALPLFAGLAIAILVGWLILIGGIVGLVTTFLARGAPGFWWSLLSAVLWIAAGIALLAAPIAGLVYLTFLLVVWFAFEGVSMIMYALAHRRSATARWAWVLATGIIDLVLAVVLLAGLPGTAAWAIGLLVGINLLAVGVSLTAMALIARR
jgi:uncharacterized membrane protein HdeD (DUF308 family)